MSSPWLTLDDPFGHEATHPAGACYAVRAEACCHPESVDPGRSEDELAVGRECLGTVDKLDDLGIGELRHAPGRRLEQRGEPVPVRRQEPVVEIGRDSSEAPGSGDSFVAARHEASALAAEVHEQRRVAHCGHVAGKIGGLGYDVLVRHRHDRDVEAGQSSYLVGVDAPSIDDDLAFDTALVGLDGANDPANDVEIGDPRLGENRRSSLAGTFGKGHGELARVEVPVGREEGGTVHPFDRHRGKELLRLLGRHEVQRQAEGLGPGSLTLELLHAFRGGSKAKGADLAPAGLELHLVSQFAVELDRVHHHLREAQRGAQLADETSRMEGRAARQLRPLDEDDVIPAETGKPVQDGAAADSSPDDDCACPLDHGPGSLARRHATRPESSIPWHHRASSIRGTGLTEG